MLFTSHDHQVTQTVANRIMEILPGGVIDKRENYDEYIEDEEVKRMRELWS
jgi:ATPase subunit of ABC transporter with duplicated ATPase domains